MYDPWYDSYGDPQVIPHIYNKDVLERLYAELLGVLDEKSFTPERWQKLLNEKDNKHKVKAIMKFWDSFDAPSDDPNVDHKHNRDYLWDKIFEAPPSESIHYDTEGLEDWDQERLGKGLYDIGNITDAVQGVM